MYSSANFAHQSVSSGSACVFTSTIDSVAFLAMNAVMSYGELTLYLSRSDTYKFHHGSDLCPNFLLVSCNVQTAQQSSLFCGIPMKFHRSSCWDKPSTCQHSESFKDGDGSGTVVIGPGSGKKGKVVVGRVLMGSDDRQRERGVEVGWLESGDDRRLEERVSVV